MSVSVSVCPFCMHRVGNTIGDICCHAHGRLLDYLSGAVLLSHPVPPSRSPAPFPAAAMRWDWEPQ